MSKGLKVIFSLIIVALLAVIAVLVIELTKPKDDPKDDDTKDMITIKFDTDGGNEIEEMKIEKGSKATLPGCEKEGYTLIGWFAHDEEIKDDYTFDKDITLTAKWEKIKEEEKTFKISFDSKGGSKVSSITVVCGKTLKLPSNPKKDGYKFVSWEDKNGKTIHNDALLSCEDVTLYAYWEKEEPKTFKVTFDSKGGSSVSAVTVTCGKTLTLPKAPTKDGYTFVSWEDKNGTVINNDALLSCEDVTLYANWKEVEKKYTCPDGYTLSGTKCTSKKAASTKCPSDTYEYKGNCITLTAQAQNKDQILRVCGKSTVVVDNNGHTQEVQGDVITVPNSYYYCAYGQVNESQYECTSHGYKWVSLVNKCYRSTGSPGQNINYSCKTPETYTYLSTTEVNSLRQNANISGCFPIVDKTKYCTDDYVLTNGECIKTIEATAE